MPKHRKNAPAEGLSTGATTSKRYLFGSLKLQPVSRKLGLTTFAHFTYKYSDLHAHVVEMYCKSSDLTEDDVSRLLLSERRKKRARHRKGIDLPWPPTNMAKAWSRARITVDLWIAELVVEEEVEAEVQGADKKPSPTVRDFWAQFAAWKIRNGDWGASYQNSAACNYRKWVGPHFGHMKLSEVTPGDLSEWRLLMADSLTRATLENKWMVFKSMFEFARKLDAQGTFIGEDAYRLHKNLNPFSGVISTKLKRTGGTPKVPVTFTQDELAGIVSKTESLYPTVHPIVVMAIQTGMRIGEIRALRWGDVEWYDDKPSVINVNRSASLIKGTAVITEGKTKNAARRIPMTEALELVMRDWLANAPTAKQVLSKCIRHRANDVTSAEWAFKQRKRRGGAVDVATDRDGPVGYVFLCVRNWKPEDPCTGILGVVGILHKMKSAALASGIEKINGWHDFRHTWISHAVSKGIDWKWIQSIVGHGDLKTTMGYTHLVDSEDINVEKVFSALVSDPLREP